MLKRILPVLFVLAVLLAACTPQSTPSIATADVQSTAVSIAWTMMAATQLANPTSTPLPPTETPTLPTFTSTPEQLIPPTNTPMPSDANDCNKVLNVGEAGPMKNVRIENENKSQVNLSLNLYTPNDFGQCGYLSYVLKSGEKRKVEIPTGYWSAFSWILNPPSQASKSFYIGPSGSDDLLRLVIKKNVIAWVGP
jgi:hypothetical protein